MQKKMKHLLSESELSINVVTIINNWLDYNYEIRKRFAWAQLTLTVCDSAGGNFEVGLQGAVAMELYALAADILDDIQDQDNNALPWRKVPLGQAINLATCILVLSYKALSNISSSHFEDVSNVFNQMGLQACDGQFQEFSNDIKESISLKEYFSIIMKKSGSITAGACKIGAILGNADQTQINQLEQFGINLGVMSQIKNDLADFLDLETKNDFVSGRKTLPLVYLLEVLSKEKAEELKSLSSLAKTSPDQFGSKEKEQLKKLVINEGTIHYSLVMHELYKQRAIEIIAGISITKKGKEKLIKLVR
ncbi:competence protein ComQ [Desulfosporosinus lacus DSM 15449]|uniref:Competence protein ComQ n=2 Tax=Desulfosporosinus TaxID=79206 RepID=A0A1M6GTE7_9FIRM|nr:competence protein ComQ [Desulfosporosinus lacus DSM 15449]